MGKSSPSSLFVFLQLLGVAAGMMLSHGGWAVMHEYLATQKYDVDGVAQRFDSFYASQIVNCTCTMAVALVVMLGLSAIGKPVHTQRMPWRPLLMTVFTQIVCGRLNFLALRYVSYPVYMSMQMCRVVPTVLVGAFVYGVTYGRLKIFSALCIGVSVAVFFSFNTHGDAAKQSGTAAAFEGAPIVGVLLVGINLFIEGFGVAAQDVIFQMKPHAIWVMFITAVCHGVVVCGILLVAEVGEAFSPNFMIKPELGALVTIYTNAPVLALDMLLLGLFAAVGKVFVFICLSLFGSLTVVAITTTRKLSSFLVSVSIFGHHIVAVQWCALVVTAIGLGCEAYGSVQARRSKLKSE